MAGFWAFGAACVLSAMAPGLYGAFLQPKFHLKYTGISAPGFGGKQCFIGFLACLAAFFPLCVRFAAGEGNICHIIIAALLLASGAADMAYEKIPNALTGMILVIALLTALYQTIIYNEYFSILTGAAGGIAAAAFPALAAWTMKKSVGAGDIKLLFATGSYLRVGLSVHFFALTFILAAFFSLIWIAVKKANRKSHIPLAPFMAYSFAITVYFEHYIEAWVIANALWRLK